MPRGQVRRRRISREGHKNVQAERDGESLQPEVHAEEAVGRRRGREC